jgi:hypothetical protein
LYEIIATEGVAVCSAIVFVMFTCFVLLLK